MGLMSLRSRFRMCLMNLQSILQRFKRRQRRKIVRGEEREFDVRSERKNI